MVWKPGNPIPTNRKPDPRRVCAEWSANMAAIDLNYAGSAAKGLSSGMQQTASLVADPPLTTKIIDMLDEVQSRLHGASRELGGLSGRLFGIEPDFGKAEASEQPADFSGLVAERLHYLIGLAGDLNGAATRINSRI
jgi:hypothetical protein